MSDKGPGHAEDLRIAGERSGGQLRQLPIVARWQIVANFADLPFDEMVVVEQPLGGRCNGTTRADRTCDGAIGFEQNRFVVPQSNGEGSPGRRPRGDGLGRCKALGMLLETLDTEELLADGLFVIPWCSLRPAPEGAKNYPFHLPSWPVSTGRGELPRDYASPLHPGLNAAASDPGPDSGKYRSLAPVIHPPSTQTPPKRGLRIYDSTACGGIFKIYDGHIDSTVDTTRAVRCAAQCTASLFAGATVFFGSVSSSTPSLYLALAVASSTS